MGQDLAANSDDGLEAPPESWNASPDSEQFDRALSQADWHLSGPVAASNSVSMPVSPGEFRSTLTV